MSPTIALRVFAANSTLRLLSLRLPGTLSFGSILSDLGLPAFGPDSDDLFTLTNTSIKFVPLVNGQTGEWRQPHSAAEMRHLRQG